MGALRRLALPNLLLVAALCWAAVAAAATITFPPLTGRVVDQAHLLSPSAIESLDTKLAAHEQATGQQVVVATVPSLQGQSIEDFGYQLGRAWGIGQKDKNTGAILLVAPNERQVRIEVGYGLEGTLTDALSRVIIERDILPAFRAGNMPAGIVAGTDRMLAVLRGDPDAVPQAPRAASRDPGSLPPGFLIFLFVIFIIFMRRRGGFLPLFIPGPSIWRSGGGGGFSDGGFSGGGGSFGGGGASGRW